MRTTLLLQWRNITRRYASYEALVFDENNFYSDQASYSAICRKCKMLFAYVQRLLAGKEIQIVHLSLSYKVKPHHSTSTA